MKSYLEILKWTSTMWHGPKPKLRVPVLPPGWVFHCVSVQIAGDSRVFPGSADVLFWCYGKQKWRLTGEGGLLTGLQKAGRERGKERRRKNEGGKKEPPPHTHTHPPFPPTLGWEYLRIIISTRLLWRESRQEKRQDALADTANWEELFPDAMSPCCLFSTLPELCLTEFIYENAVQLVPL